MKIKNIKYLMCSISYSKYRRSAAGIRTRRTLGSIPGWRRKISGRQIACDGSNPSIVVL